MVTLACEQLAWLQLLTLVGHQARRWEPKRLRLRLFSAARRLAVADPPAALRTALWFGGAVVVHDLVLFPLYALADRGLIALARRGRGRVSVLGHLRVPLTLSGLLLLIFLPVRASRPR